MAFDYKKEYKEFYLPKNRPEVVKIPPMNYVAVRGKGDPNEEGGVYKQAIGLLYAVAYTLRMSAKSGHKIRGFFEYVVPPQEGFWWQEGRAGVDFERKQDFCWTSMIRLPERRECSRLPGWPRLTSLSAGCLRDMILMWGPMGCACPAGKSSGSALPGLF